MTPLAIIPGIGNSGPDHWQTHWQIHWQANMADAHRLQPSNWDAPSLPDWVAALDQLVEEFKSTPILVAHSLGCLLVAHWGARKHKPGSIAGALLVAPPDPTGPAFPEEALSFSPTPLERMAFPTLVVSSSNDPYGSQAYAERVAQAWGAELVLAGPLGHINSTSGLGDWPWGRALLAKLNG